MTKQQIRWNGLPTTLDEYLLLFNLFLCSNFLSFLCNSAEALIAAIKPDVKNSMRFIISAKWVMSQTHAGNLLAPWRKSLYFCFTFKKTFQIYISYLYNTSFREPFAWIKDISNILSIFNMWTFTARWRKRDVLFHSEGQPSIIDLYLQHTQLDT